MHSRIIQLSKEPIKKEDYIQEEDFYDSGFIGTVADYVSDETDREDDINWFIQAYQLESQFNKEDDSLIITKEYILSQFQKNFDELKSKVNKMSLEDFIDPIKSYGLQSIIDGPGGFYIDSKEYGLMTFDTLLRRLLEKEEKFYIGGTVDYHF